MIARDKDETRPAPSAGIYQRLAAPIPTELISWRIDGKPVAKDGKFVARFVAYIEANTVRERLDSVVPGEWDSHLVPLPTVDKTNRDGTVVGAIFAFRCRLTVLGVSREDVGQGTDYKSAATDAFKRAAVRFGIGHELYDYEQNWVQVDGDGKFARAVEDPNDVYTRRQASKAARASGASGAEKSEKGAAVNRGTAGVAPSPAAPRAAAPQRSAAATPPNGSVAIPTECPKCGGDLWDNRAKKASGQFAAKAPDFKCKDRTCDTPVWLDAKKGGKAKSDHNFGDALPGEFDGYEDELPPVDDLSDIPF